MNTTLKILLLVFGGLFAIVILLGAGMLIGRFVFGSQGWWMPMHAFNTGGFSGLNRYHSPGMMRQGEIEAWNEQGCEYNGGMPFQRGMGQNWNRQGQTCNDYQGMQPGMMGSWSQDNVESDPLSMEEAADAINTFLADYGNDDLVLAEIMIFDNHAYAEIIEASTGIGAMEVLVDPVTLSVYPEHGPNRMWNQKYSQMGRGMMGGYFRSDASAGEMNLSPQEAIEAAQAYLELNNPALSVDDHASQFYGYYTLHTTRDGDVVGMLSVNGYNGDVFIHFWHGDFIEMQEFGETHD